MYRLTRPLYLASLSPRRKAILTQFGFPFKVLPSHASERTAPGLSPAQKVKVLALRKALAAAANVPNGAVLGFDTIVFFEGRVLEKPRSPAEAFRMLRMLSGREHAVYSGAALVLKPEGRETVAFSKTLVRFRKLDDTEIKNYINTGEPFDKAGAYGIQAIGGSFVKSVKGCFFNVVGLPVEPLMRFLRPFILYKSFTVRS